MIPVGNTIAPPNPNQGLQSLSSMLGIQQQRIGIQQAQQNLQTGQAVQERAQAEAQQQTQTATQRQAASQFFQNYDISKHVGDDGTLDLNQAMTDPGLRATGDAAPGIIQSLADIKTSQLDAKTKLAALDSGQRQNFYQNIGGLSADADVKAGNNTGVGKVLDEIDRFGQSGGPQAAAVAATYLPLIKNLQQSGQTTKLGEVLRNFQLQALDAGKQVEMTTPGQISNAANQVVNRNKLTGALALPSAAPGVNPRSPQIATEAAAGTSRATGVASQDIDKATEVANLQQPSSAAIPLTHQIDNLSHEISSGHLAKMLSETGNYLGFSDINQARSQLNKDLGQVKALAIARSGSDARAATILEGYPTDTTPEQTTHAAMDYIRGTAKQNLARGQLLQQQGQNLSGFQRADTNLVGTTNPLQHEYRSLNNVQDQAAFLKRNFHSKTEAKAFTDQQ